MSTVTQHRRSVPTWRRFGGRGGRGCRSGSPEVRPMTRVFLSYASADSEVAGQLTRDWRERGVDVFRFGEPEHQAEIIVAEIERERSAAEHFVALMSPAYLASEWCKRESRLAIHRENTLRRQFIF